MARVQDSEDGKLTELFIDGNFVAGWTKLDITDHQRRVICVMVEQAVEYGKREKAAEIRKVLGAN